MINMMDSLIQSLPEAIRKHMEGREYTIDDMGKSGSKVLIFEDMVLKITDKPCDDIDAVEMMRWLEGKIPAPRVIVFEEDDSYSYLLMSRVMGKIACDKYYLERPKELVPLLSRSVKMLQSIDITDCPVIKDLDRELKKAAYKVENGLVDISDAEPCSQI